MFLFIRITFLFFWKNYEENLEKELEKKNTFLLVVKKEVNF